MSYAVILMTSLALAGGTPLSAPGAIMEIANPTPHQRPTLVMPPQFAIIREDEWRKRLRYLMQQAGHRFDGPPPTKNKQGVRRAVWKRR